MANPSERQQNNITIGIAMHKPYPIPHSDLYLPIHVGAAVHPDVLPNIQGDDTGDNISTLNPTSVNLQRYIGCGRTITAAIRGSSTTAVILQHSIFTSYIAENASSVPLNNQS